MTLLRSANRLFEGLKGIVYLIFDTISLNMWQVSVARLDILTTYKDI